MNKKNFDYNCISNQIDSFIESNHSLLNAPEAKVKQPKGTFFKLMLMAAPIVALAGYVLSIH
ncbi:hypothetical protein [Brevibacillus brevis]|uniref:hypothetical protein n=1 Tax=Brevibacillus brevis TaxID=1393 RepID=UPI0007D8BA48|nr:hypothetical protein [Brevibacillus brevis]